MYDLLPSPANLQRWGLVEDPICHICDKPGTMQHALSSCQTALTQGRYRWRHDTVLRELKKKKACPAINFVKEGQTGRKTKASTTSILDESDCWEMKVDLGKQLFFPNIIHTAQRPDIVIWSPNDRKLVMVELTVPWETRCEEAYERKMPSILNYKNSAEVVVGVPGYFPWG